MNYVFLVLILYLPHGQQYARKAATKSPRVAPRQCKINTYDLMQLECPPMPLHPDEMRIFYPNYRERFILLKSGARIDMFCTGNKGMFVKGELLRDKQRLQLFCEEGYVFKLNEDMVNITDVECGEIVKSHAWLSRRICGVKGFEIEVGFRFPNNSFLPQYIVCFNFMSQTTEYTRHFIKPIVTWKKGLKRSRSTNIIFFNVSRPIYALYEDPRIINRQLGRSDYFRWTNFHKEVINVGKFFLVAQTDFYYTFEQRATRYYINVVPHFNTLPWHVLRMSLRWYAWKNKVQLDVHTGTMKRLRLFHVKDGTVVNLNLDAEGQKIPIPSFIWLAAYDKKNQAGVAVISTNFFIYNNMFFPLCSDISSKLPWMVHLSNSSYACEYNAWAKVVKYSLNRQPMQKILGENMEVPDKFLKIRPDPFRDYN